MAKVYTAQEMREAADNFWVGGVICEVKDEDGRVVKHIKHDSIIAMLRQAADAMEREARREKRYHYEVWYTAKDGGARRSTERALSLEVAKRILSMYREFKDAHIVRREVGEWEEVNDGE